MSPADAPAPFSILFAAPPGFDHPDLGAVVRRALLWSTAAVRRHRPLSLFGLSEEPVTRHAFEAVDEAKWQRVFRCADWRLPGPAGHRRGLAGLVPVCDAVLGFHAGEVPRDLADLFRWAEWAGTRCRAVRVI